MDGYSITLGIRLDTKKEYSVANSIATQITCLGQCYNCLPNDLKQNDR
jgi:hypothetical protein